MLNQWQNPCNYGLAEYIGPHNHLNIAISDQSKQPKMWTSSFHILHVGLLKRRPLTVEIPIKTC